MLLEQLNSLDHLDANSEFLKCCGSRNWAMRMVTSRPFASVEDVCSRATEIWGSLETADWLEAFRSHPKIGEKKSEAETSKQSQTWSNLEQSGIASAHEQTLSELARLNREYEEKFGYIYIVCASGKSAGEMLEILKTRIDNPPDEEIAIAASEQAKITEIRLRKLIAS